MNFTQANHNTGDVSNRFAGPPPDGAVMIVSTGDRCLSAAECERLRKVWDDAMRNSTPIILDGTMRLFQAVDGKFVEVGAPPPKREPRSEWAPLAITVATVLVFLAVVLVMGFLGR